MSMDTAPAFGHTDEVEEFDGHDIEDWTLYVVHLDSGGASDVFLNAAVPPIFGKSYKRYRELAHRLALHCITHFVRPARTVRNCHIPGLVRDLLSRDLGEPLLQEAEAVRKFKKGMLVRTSGMLQQRYADQIDAVMVTGCDEALAVGGKIVPVLSKVERVKAELRTDRAGRRDP